MKDRKKEFILWFKEISIKDINLVGGKNAALGEMYSELTPLGVQIPNGFTITAYAYNYFLENAGIKEKIQEILNGLDTHNIKDLQKRGNSVRKLILRSNLPKNLIGEIEKSYRELCEFYKQKNLDVAVRSSATAEDLPGASFAGAQETYLNVVGIDETVKSVRKCFASLFTDRAISYREDKGFSHFDVKLSVGIQKMVRSDLAVSGVIFTIDTETGFDNVVVINSSYGLGETIVKGRVTPDEFIVFKPTFEKGYKSILARNLGDKDKKLVYAKSGTKQVTVSRREHDEFSLKDAEILKLTDWSIKIEKHFSRERGKKQPMDIEWAKDGRTKELFIVQARPETVHSTDESNVYKEYRLKESGKIILSGTAVGTKIASGNVRIIKDSNKIDEFKKGEILVTEITDPDWEPIMKIASAIVTDKGGRTSHAAIVSRELGIPCIVGSKDATTRLKSGQLITVDCSSGKAGNIYSGKIAYRIIEHELRKIPKTRTKVMVNIGSPDEAFKNHYLPVQGVGLGRLEFIIASHIKIHPNALIHYEDLKKLSIRNLKIRKILEQIDILTTGYKNKTDYYVKELAEGIAKIGAAFWPHEVIIRFSDFKTNEYKTLIGGELYEPDEGNPMIGWRGASRYYHPDFQAAFGLECRAIYNVRREIGLDNVIPMVPFCRTPEEGEKVIQLMEKYGLSKRKDHGFKIYVMCEIPSNILMAKEFLNIFDGMSIGSNDLAQLTLGIDRDSSIVNRVANENDPSVRKLIADIIWQAKKRKKYIGICGQAPSDFPEFGEFLVESGIESMSLNPDTVIKMIPIIYQKEKRRIRIRIRM